MPYKDAGARPTLKNSLPKTGEKPPKRLHLSILGRCNEKCLFCVKGGDESQQELATAECIRRIYIKRKAGFSELILDGGEPTLKEGLSVIIRSALELGYKSVEIITNGVVLADRGKLEKISSCHPEALKKVLFTVSLHSHMEKTSERLTATPGTFRKTLAGIDNILAKGFKNLGLFHVITTLNYKNLPAFADFVVGSYGTGVDVVFSHIFPSGSALKNIRLYPRLSMVEPWFREAVTRLEAAKVPVSLASCGMIPACLLGGRFFLAVSQYWQDNPENAVISDSNKEEAFNFFSKEFDQTNKVKGKQCVACRLGDICGGIWKFYARRYGLEELKPVK